MRVMDLEIGGQYEVEIGGKWVPATFNAVTERAKYGAVVYRFTLPDGNRAEFSAAGVLTRVRKVGEGDASAAASGRNVLSVILALILCAAGAIGSSAHAGARPSARPVPAAVGVVNVNTATEDELMLLPGVGDAIASDIVEYRGGVNTGVRVSFRALEDLAKVRGLGGKGKRLAKLAPYVVFSGPTTLKVKVKVRVRVQRVEKKPAGKVSQARDLRLYSPAARESIVRGLADGTVKFEESAEGGEYIYTPRTKTSTR